MNTDIVYQVNAALAAGQLGTVARIAREHRSKWAHMSYQAARARAAGRCDDAIRAQEIADALLGAAIVQNLAA